MGRIQIIDNWSPDLHTNDKDNLCIGVEYFCQKDDDLWKKSDPELVQLAMLELTQLHLLKPGQVPADTCVQRVEKAYPCYWGGYSEISSLRQYLDGFSNLICVGRNGQHRYNNLDHAMETAFFAVDYITGHGTKMSVWDVNSYLEYHENK
jgi:protoporphyrinogen oxidase